MGTIRHTWPLWLRTLPWLLSCHGYPSSHGYCGYLCCQIHLVLGFRSVDTSSLVKIMTIKESWLFMCLLAAAVWIITSDTTLECGCANCSRLVNQATKFCTFVRNIFSIITAVFLPDIQTCVSAHMQRAHSATYVQERCMGHCTTVGPQYGNCLVQPFWSLNFECGSWSLRIFVDPCRRE
jgi:hypothetical protein